MRERLIVGWVALIGCSCMFAQEMSDPPTIPIPPGQTARQPGDERSRRGPVEVVLPLPIISPVAVLPGEFEPLTPQQKVARTLNNTFGTRALANRLLLAGVTQWRDHPEEWPGQWDGYGMRVAHRMGRLMVRNGVRLAADVAFKTDPRYDGCECAGFLPRTGHAWKRVFVALKDDGGETVNVSSLAGAYVSPMITDHWYPSRLNTWNHKFQSGTEYLMWRGLTNMVREFWPEISRLPGLRRASGVYDPE